MKRKLLFASIGIIALFLLVPFAQATSSQVWFDDTTEIVWEFTEEDFRFKHASNEFEYILSKIEFH